MSPGASRSVQRVSEALAAADAAGRVIELTRTARSAVEAAAALGVPVGAIVKTLVFMVGERPVMALVAGDRRCRMEHLADILDLSGPVTRASAALVRAATGFAIGGVAPVGHPSSLPAAMDASLGRFEQLYAAAGHPHCVFATRFAELQAMTGAVVSDALSTRDI